MTTPFEPGRDYRLNPAVALRREPVAEEVA